MRRPRVTRRTCSATCTGRRIVRPCSASARVIALADPPRRVGRELEAHRVVELLDRADQAEVALLDQVEQRHAGLRVVARDRHHEPEVRLDQLSLRRLVALVLAPGELALLGGCQQAAVADLAHVELEGILRRLGDGNGGDPRRRRPPRPRPPRHPPPRPWARRAQAGARDAAQVRPRRPARRGSAPSAPISAAPAATA